METYENYTLSVIVVQVDAGPLFFPSKGNARITEVHESAAQHGGVPLRRKTYKSIIVGLPESREGVKLIVARGVAALNAISASPRTDLVYPDPESYINGEGLAKGMRVITGFIV